jgi:alkylation response protein AidB-like acyl-CoA dehydrogenase
VIENKNRNAQEAVSIEVAEANREMDWKSRSFIASLFMGDLDMSLAFPFPEQDEEDRKRGDAKCAEVDAWCAEHLDGEAIDADRSIPPHVFRGLNELGLFGIKIPQEYGGLGMSQTNYMRILAVVARYCGSTAATLSAHQSIGVPQPLKLFGTPEQKKKFLPRIAAGEITAFGLTEPTVGSDPANMQTAAELSGDGTHWILNGEKLWCTNGVIADMYVVMARTPPVMKKGREVKQITAFIVEAEWEGVEVVHRCHFMGLRAIENGVIRFRDVKVPVENVIGAPGEGLKIALSTLNDGRLGIPAIVAEDGAALAAFSARWARSRFQWGKHIGYHEAGADKLARVVSAAWAMGTLARYCAALSDKGDVDIRMEAATAKMFNTEHHWSLVDTALQLRGGRGFETATSLEARGEAAYPLERSMRDARINRIVEGTTDVMHLFLAREALDKHLQNAGGFFRKGSFSDKWETFVKCAKFYPGWYTKLWLGGLLKRYEGYDPALAKQLRWVERRSRRLARTLFHKMLTLGPKLEMRQLTLARIVDIGAELSVMALVIARAQTELRDGRSTHLAESLYWLQHRREAVDNLFREIGRNADKQARDLAEQVMSKAEVLPEVDMSHLEPLPREFGRELTDVSGTRKTRGPSRKRKPAAGKDGQESAAK